MQYQAGRTAEEAVLFAALEKDTEEVLRRLAAFLPGERTRLYEACYQILKLTTRLEDELEGVR